MTAFLQQLELVAMDQSTHEQGGGVERQLRDAIEAIRELRDMLAVTASESRCPMCDGQSTLTMDPSHSDHCPVAEALHKYRDED